MREQQRRGTDSLRYALHLRIEQCVAYPAEIFKSVKHWSAPSLVFNSSFSLKVWFRFRFRSDHSHNNAQ